MRTINEQVKKAGYYYIGHFGSGQLQIDCNNCRIVIGFQNQHKIYDLLYKIFDIDSEDGIYLQSIEGKYCRIIVDSNFNVKALQHIIKDDNVVFLDELNKEKRK